MSFRGQSLEAQLAALAQTPTEGLSARLRRMLRLGWQREADRRALAREVGLLEWGRRYLPTHFTSPPSKMHRWLADELDRLPQQRGTKLNVLGPRGGAKSTLVTLAYVLRTAVLGWEPYVWIVSDTADQAQAHLKNLSRELRENRRLARDFPELCGPHHGIRGERILLANGTLVEAFGTGQRLRGRRHGPHRPSLIVCDDLQNDDHMRSATLRETTTAWFRGTLLKAGDVRTNFVNLATALHRDALALQLERTPGWISRRFRAIERWPDDMARWAEWERIYTDRENPHARRDAWAFYEKHHHALEAGAELLWPEVEKLYTLMKMRVEEGEAAFEREKQNSPIDPARCEWPEAYFTGELWFGEWPAEVQFKAIAIDPSKGGDARQGDYSAVVVLGVDRRGVLYVEADLARRPTPEIVARGVTLCRQHRAAAFGVEANQFQQLLCDEFVAEFARQGIDWCTPAAIHNYVNKQVRIRRLGPYLAQRRMRFLAGSPGTQLLVEQLRDFPLGQHDDGPDALEMAVRLAEAWHRSGNADDGLGGRLRLGS